MARMNWQWAAVGSALVLVSCSSAPKSEQAAETQNGGNSTTPAQSFSSPVVQPVKKEGVVAVPGLLKPTNPKSRAPKIAAGRTNPFESSGTVLVATTKPGPAVPPAPTVIPAVGSATPGIAPLPSVTAPKPASKVAAKPAPKVPARKAPAPVAIAMAPIPVSPLPLMPPSFPNVGGLPPLGMPALPVAPPSPTAIADAIEVTGAVQVGGKWQIILKESASDSSRYVSPGDRVAGGKVLVKKVLASGSAEPLVVLEQNGKEVSKMLGAQAAMASVQ